MADLNLAEVVRQAVALLDSDDVVKTTDSLKIDSPEKEIAVEYVRGYTNFIKDLVETDIKRSLVRADFEVREHVGHINAMLKVNHPDVFMKMILNSPKHYKTMLGSAKR
jgi:hypothetical protein